MAPQVTTHRSRAALGSVLGVLAVTLPTGYLVARFSFPATQSRYFPWIVGRALGLGAYVALVALVALGIWLRHPWRHRWPFLHPEARLRLHAALGATTCLLVGGHIAALAADPYAGVEWPGTLVPGTSSYRPVAVTLGVLGLYFLVAITATAAVGGRLVGRHWLAVHRLATPTVSLVWFHGVLAGSDTPRLRVFYAVSGAVIIVLTLTRVLARSPGTGPGRGELPSVQVPVGAWRPRGTAP